MKILIVDDEKPARDRLRQLVDDFGVHEVVAKAANGEQAIAMAMASKHNPDVVLLDIRMPGVDGIETAHHLNSLSTPPAVVFTTAYDEYAIDAFEARAIGYVLKPVRRERLETALQHAARVTGQMLKQMTAVSNLKSTRQHVCARVHGELRLIPISSIVYCNADQKYVTVYHKGGENLIDDSLKAPEEEFADTFVRIHRGALVSVAHIDRLEKTGEGTTRVVLRNIQDNGEDNLIISRRHLADVRRRLRKG
ncbi:MAG: LytTR family DNA-binding domain-containing protein [Proteobacteria bacterium]|nr:LytTR family DNA-binding domain-containing protein [Pseudomonadota bacterium]